MRYALRRLWARWGGYFVLPCPLCGREMLGSDRHLGDVACTARLGRGHIICSDCTRRGRSTEFVHDPALLRTCTVCGLEPVSATIVSDVSGGTMAPTQAPPVHNPCPQPGEGQ